MNDELDGLFQLQVSVAYFIPAPWLQRENKFCRGRAECRRRREQDWDPGWSVSSSPGALKPRSGSGASRVQPEGTGFSKRPLCCSPRSFAELCGRLL